MEKKSIINNKMFLYLTEFFAGMSVMAVELGASRLLAPYFSSSQIVWTIIIGTIMIAMALGNIYGGRSADQDPNPDKLYGRIVIAAIWITLIPILGKYVILLISGLLIVAISTNFLIWAAFLACMLIFVFPLFLLGTVTPSLVKYSVDSLDDNGKTVGNLSAFNTIGSIIGTFVPTFVTIPTVGTTITFFIFAGILLAIAISYFVVKRQRSVKCIVAVIVMCLSCFMSEKDSFAFWEDNLLYEGESIYNYLQVKEDDDSVILSTNVLFGVQSIYIKNDELTGMYYDYAMAAPVMAGVEQKEEMNILVLGMGSGTYAMQCMKYYENVNIEGVEIDQKITNLAKKYFELPENVKVTTYDGRAYLQTIENKYDVIMVDAYQDITIPFQMSSVEFFRLVKDHLNEDGVMVVNMNMRGNSEGNINQYLSDTISCVFDCVYTVDVSGSSNRELFAFQDESVMDVYQRDLKKQNDEKLKTLLREVYDHMEKYESGSYIMTDDQAPVEILGMKVIDELISEEIGYYKKIFKKDGIKGLVEEFS
ncbi:MAG: fused MFS/spermidine synthase [Lachnospiraceae bacterium]|nr:fused MFS/spermidine synthase [Lachnospiraceae bacterium]